MAFKRRGENPEAGRSHARAVSKLGRLPSECSIGPAFYGLTNSPSRLGWRRCAHLKSTEARKGTSLRRSGRLRSCNKTRFDKWPSSHPPMHLGWESSAVRMTHGSVSLAWTPKSDWRRSSTAASLSDLGGINARRKRRKGGPLVRAGYVPFPTEVRIRAHGSAFSRLGRYNLEAPLNRVGGCQSRLAVHTRDPVLPLYGSPGRRMAKTLGRASQPEKYFDGRHTVREMWVGVGVGTSRTGPENRH